jgi:hypothetical protein
MSTASSIGVMNLVGSQESVVDSPHKSRQLFAG